MMIKVREARKAVPLTQKQLSALTGISQGHISHMERYEVAPSYESVQRLAKALGLKPSQLQFTNSPIR